MATPVGPVAVLVSYETFFPDRGRSGVRAGGQIILVPTNTSSYSSAQAPAQELAASRLQAVEEGRDLLQAAPTGYSAIVDNHGDVLQQTPLSVSGSAQGQRPAPRRGHALRTGRRSADSPTGAFCGAGGLDARSSWSAAASGGEASREIRAAIPGELNGRPPVDVALGSENVRNRVHGLADCQRGKPGLEHIGIPGGRNRDRRRQATRLLLRRAPEFWRPNRYRLKMKYRAVQIQA